MGLVCQIFFHEPVTGKYSTSLFVYSQRSLSSTDLAALKADILEIRLTAEKMMMNPRPASVFQKHIYSADFAYLKCQSPRG